MSGKNARIRFKIFPKFAPIYNVKQKRGADFGNTLWFSTALGADFVNIFEE